MADRIVVLNGGHIAQMGAPLDLYDRPANVFVAGFIGSPSMNLVEGEVRDGHVVAGDLRLPLAGAAAGEGRRVVYGIRPEHLEIAPGGIAAQVAVVEPTGSETHLVLRAAGREMVAVSRERHGFAPGDEIRLSPVPGLVHLFDAGTGERI